MSKKIARRVGFLAAAIPVVGLLITYIISCHKHGTPFSSDGWVYLPAFFCCMPTLFLLMPFGRLIPNMSTKGIAVHIFAPIEVAIIAVLNFYIAFYAVVLIGAIIRRTRDEGRHGTGTS